MIEFKVAEVVIPIMTTLGAERSDLGDEFQTLRIAGRYVKKKDVDEVRARKGSSCLAIIGAFGSIPEGPDDFFARAANGRIVIGNKHSHPLRWFYRLRSRLHDS